MNQTELWTREGPEGPLRRPSVAGYRRRSAAVLNAAAPATEEPPSAPSVESWSFTPVELRRCLDDLFGTLRVADYTKVVRAIGDHLMADERGAKSQRVSDDAWSEQAPAWNFGPEKLRLFYNALLPVDDVEKAVDTHLKGRPHLGRAAEAAQAEA